LQTAITAGVSASIARNKQLAANKISFRLWRNGLGVLFSAADRVSPVTLSLDRVRTTSPEISTGTQFIINRTHPVRTRGRRPPTYRGAYMPSAIGSVDRRGGAVRLRVTGAAG